MGVLKKSSHERFAQLVAREGNATQAYVSVYGAAKGAGQSAARLLKNAEISLRIAELTREVAKNLLADTILERQSRLKALQNRWEMLNRVIKERGETYGRLTIHGYPMGRKPPAEGEAPEEEMPAPGASTGLVCLDWRGKDALQAVWKVDTGLLSEMRAIEEQAARELGEWNPDAGIGGGIQVPVQVNVTFVSPSHA